MKSDEKGTICIYDNITEKEYNFEKVSFRKEDDGAFVVVRGKSDIFIIYPNSETTITIDYR